MIITHNCALVNKRMRRDGFAVHPVECGPCACRNGERRDVGIPPYSAERIRAVFSKPNARNSVHSCRTEFRGHRRPMYRKEAKPLCPLNQWGQRGVIQTAKCCGCRPCLLQNWTQEIRPILAGSDFVLTAKDTTGKQCRGSIPLIYGDRASFAKTPTGMCQRRLAALSL